MQDEIDSSRLSLLITHSAVSGGFRYGCYVAPRHTSLIDDSAERRSECLGEVASMNGWGKHQQMNRTSTRTDVHRENLIKFQHIGTLKRSKLVVTRENVHCHLETRHIWTQIWSRYTNVNGSCFRLPRLINMSWVSTDVVHLVWYILYVSILFGSSISYSFVLLASPVAE